MVLAVACDGGVGLNLFMRFVGSAWISDASVDHGDHSWLSADSDGSCLSKAAADVGNGTVGYMILVASVLSGSDSAGSHSDSDGMPLNYSFNLSALENSIDVCCVAADYVVDSVSAPDGDVDCRPTTDECGDAADLLAAIVSTVV